VADDYNAEIFRGALGEAFDVDADGVKVALVLDDVLDLPTGIREQGCFKLTFRGPPEPLVPQGLYRFERGDGSYDIFIVPIARDQQGSTYEAVFN
jgi:hypothetical protein